MSRKAHLYVASTIAIGLLVLTSAVTSWQAGDVPRFLTYLVLAMVASTLKVRLPAIEATFSADFVMILLAIAELGFGQTVVLASCCAVVQTSWNPEKLPSPSQLAFNVGNLAISSAAAYNLYHTAIGSLSGEYIVILLPFAASIYFVANTLIVSGVLSILQGRRVSDLWQKCFIWSFPYYLIGAAVTLWMTSANQRVSWRMSLLVLPLMYLAYVSYKLIVRQYGGSRTV